MRLIIPILLALLQPAAAQYIPDMPPPPQPPVGSVYVMTPFGGRWIRLDIDKAIRRALTPPQSQQFVEPPPPPPPQQQPSETREQWRARLFAEMNRYCREYPGDKACGPKAMDQR